MFKNGVLPPEVLDILSPPRLSRESLYAARMLLDRYQEPWRHYHNIDHIGKMALQCLEYQAVLQNPRRVMWSILGHDAVYIPELYTPGVAAGRNEQLSADLTTHYLQNILPNKELHQVQSDILATAQHTPDEPDTDQASFIDWDMSILGADEEEFDAYDIAVAKEFAFVEQSHFRRARQKVLEGFLAQDRIYITSSSYDLLEQKARANLLRTIAMYGG